MNRHLLWRDLLWETTPEGAAFTVAHMFLTLIMNGLTADQASTGLGGVVWS